MTLYHVLFFLSLLVFSSSMSLGDLFTPYDAPNDYIPSRDEIIKALGLKYTSNGIFEDTINFFLSQFRYFTSSVSFVKSLAVFGL